MRQDDPLSALNASLGGTRTVAEKLLSEVTKSRRLIRWLTAAVAVIAVAALGAIGSIAYQQTVIHGQQAALARLADQNADRVRADTRDAHDLCVKLTHSRAVILGVWKHVLSERPGDAAWLPRIEAVEPLGACPKAPAGS